MKISNLKKNLGGFELSIERLHINSPGIYGLIGPNGCGKSTAAKLMAGLMMRDSGDIDYENLCPRDITMLTQKPYLMRDTVYNNLVYPLKIRGIKPDTDLCERYLERAGLSDKKKQQAKSLSGGEQQKLAMARAIIFEPKLIIADEAVSALDIDSLGMFEQWILESQNTRPVIWLIISHQLAHIKRLCGYIFFMSDGRIADEGCADELLLKPESLMLKRYLKQETIE